MDDECEVGTSEASSEAKTSSSSSQDELDPAPRERLNAVSPLRSPRSSFDKSRAADNGSTNDVGSTGGEETDPLRLCTPVENGRPRSLAVTSSLLAECDEIRLVVEDNEDIIQESPGLQPKEFAADSSGELEGSSVGADSSEPEPGAAPEQLVVRTNSHDLPLVSPGEGILSDEETPDIPPVQDLAIDSYSDEIQEYAEEWYTGKKHVFILSEAGKPIYSRHGKEENIVGLFGVMQALLSCVQDNGDELNCIRTADRLFVFRCRPPLVLVAIAGLDESEEQLSRQLHYLTNQAVFFLTHSHMARLFKNRHNYDLRRQLTGLPKFFNGIIRFVEEEMSFLLDSTRCVPLPSSLRSEITSTILTHRCPELVFAIVLFERQIVCTVRPKQYSISPQDLHLLMNYVQTGSTRGHGEKWAPCCLPDFNDGGYLYIHDSYISETTNISLVLITNEREQHLNMIECKLRIVDQLTTQKTLERLEAAVSTPFLASDTKIPNLQHFVYKSKSSQQILTPEYAPPYTAEEDRRALHARYCKVYDSLHHKDTRLSLYYCIGPRDSVLGQLTSNSEIYCTFSPFVTRPVALNSVDKLLKWIRREESRFFIMGTGVY